MATNSATAGFLSPSTVPAYDDALDDSLHPFIVGVTGIAAQYVRPRWQPEPPQQPAFTVNWVAFGTPRREGDAFAHELQSDDDVTVSRDEIFSYLLSFYGPAASAYAERFRTGLQISQNRDVLTALNFTVVDVAEGLKVPALLKQQWVNRVDVTVRLRRRAVSVYPVLTILSADGEIKTDIPTTTTFSVTQ